MSVTSLSVTDHYKAMSLAAVDRYELLVFVCPRFNGTSVSMKSPSLYGLKMLVTRSSLRPSIFGILIYAWAGRLRGVHSMRRLHIIPEHVSRHDGLQVQWCYATDPGKGIVSR